MNAPFEVDGGHVAERGVPPAGVVLPVSSILDHADVGSVPAPANEWQALTQKLDHSEQAGHTPGRFRVNQIHYSVGSNNLNCTAALPRALTSD